MTAASMRHLFFVHSHATFLCARMVMERLGLPNKKCVFVIGRQFQLPELPHGARQFDLTFRRSFSYGDYGAMLRAFKSLRFADREISEASDGDEFHVYISYTYFSPIHLILTHRLCTGYSYLEEGLTSYYGFDEISRAYPAKVPGRRVRAFRALFLRHRIPPKITFFHPGYTRAYGFTEMSFPGWERRVTLGLPDHLRPVATPQSGTYPILVFDAIVELGKLKCECLITVLREFLANLIANDTPVLRVKYHGAQRDDASINAIKNLFAEVGDKIQIHELPASTSLEAIASGEDCIWYIFNSATGIYASLAGRTVWSLNSLVLQQDASYRRVVEELPAIFHELVPGFILNSSSMVTQ